MVIRQAGPDGKGLRFSTAAAPGSPVVQVLTAGCIQDASIGEVRITLSQDANTGSSTVGNLRQSCNCSWETVPREPLGIGGGSQGPDTSARPGNDRRRGEVSDRAPR